MSATRRFLALSSFVALFCTAQAHAFNSVLPSVHDQITKKAAAPYHFHNSAIRILMAAGDDQDVSETNLVRLKPNRRYKPAHHFDRNPGDTNQAAFSRAAEDAREQQSLAVTEKSAKSAVRALGKALHALQDFYAHSNFIDLTNDEQAACVKAIYDAKSEPPGTLKLTSYDPATGKSIKGDDYGHDQFAKDFPKKNFESKSRHGSGKTKFEVARDAAVHYSGDFLNRTKSAAGSAKWKLVTSAD